MRALTEAVATDVLARTGRALGAGPLGHDEAHSRAVADLTVYLRQHHAERDLARLGELVAQRGSGVVSRDAAGPHPIDAPGTDERSWAAWPWLSTLPGAGLAGLAGVTSAVIVAAHPDDEVLGAGGLIVDAGGLARATAAGGGHRRGALAPGALPPRPRSHGGGPRKPPPRCVPWAPGRPR